MDDSALISRYLSDNASFWANVQEPSRRVKDKSLLSRLAYLSLGVYSDKYIRSAAYVNVCYRLVDGDVDFPIDDVCMLHDFRVCVTSLNPVDSFSDCRWYLSSMLAQAAYYIKFGSKERALDVLSQCLALEDVAFSYGQLFTNVVKAELLMLALVSACGLVRGDEMNFIDRVLGRSSCLPNNYKFANEWAYEEVAYVYSMLRQIYNWKTIVSARGLVPLLGDLEISGFKWRCVGAPFNKII